LVAGRLVRSRRTGAGDAKSRQALACVAAAAPNYSKYLRRKFAELKFCAIMPAKIQSAGRLRSTI
jgi:hypothetical protein